MNSTEAGLVIAIIGMIVVVVIPLAYKLQQIVKGHKTLLGKIVAIETYLKANPTTDKQLEQLLMDVVKLAEAVDPKLLSQK